MSDELLLTSKRVTEAIEHNKDKGYPTREAIWEALHIQLAKAKQHYEQELKGLTGKLYIAEEEIRILKQNGLDGLELREK